MEYKVIIEMNIGCDTELDLSQLEEIVCDELSDAMRQDILSAAVIRVMP